MDLRSFRVGVIISERMKHMWVRPVEALVRLVEVLALPVEVILAHLEVEMDHLVDVLVRLVAVLVEVCLLAHLVVAVVIPAQILNLHSMRG